MNLNLRTALLAMALGAGLAGAVPAAQAATTGSGRSLSETRPVAEFTSIAVGGSIDVVVSQGEKTTLQVQADDNLLPLLETSVESGRLKIGWKRGESVQHRNAVRVTVVTPKLTALSAAGSGDLKLQAFSTPALKLSVAGSSSASLAGLSTDDLGISIAGSGDVRGSGKAGKMKISIAGSGDVKLIELKADDVGVTIAGSGDAEVFARKTLNVSIAGSGDVVYAGDAVVKSSVAGSGSVKKR
jgi:hypothetical protein